MRNEKTFRQALNERFAIGFAARISRMRKADIEFAQGSPTSPRRAELEYTPGKGMALVLSIMRVVTTFLGI